MMCIHTKLDFKTSNVITLLQQNILPIEKYQISKINPLKIDKICVYFYEGKPRNHARVFLWEREREV